LHNGGAALRRRQNAHGSFFPLGNLEMGNLKKAKKKAS